jgi:hypothetical protein
MLCLIHEIPTNISVFIYTIRVMTPLHTGSRQFTSHQYSLNQIGDDCLTVLWPGDRSGFILSVPALMHLYCLQLLGAAGSRVVRVS